MGNCTFSPKLNKKVMFRKPEASIVVQNYYTTKVSARRGTKPTWINKDLLTEELMKQEQDKRDQEKLERRAAKALKKRGSKSKEKKKDSDDSKSVSDFGDEDEDSEDEVDIAIGMRLKEGFANSA